MDDLALRVFQGEVARQSRFGLLAARELDSALREALSAVTQLDPETFHNRQDSMDRLWFYVHALLIAAANVSKLLRRADVRESLGITDSALDSRTLRNHLEHFDQRLETWAEKRTGFVDSNVGPIGGVDAKDQLRNFDPDRHAVTFEGIAFELKPIIGALREVRNAAEAASGLGWGDTENC